MVSSSLAHKRNRFFLTRSGTNSQDSPRADNLTAYLLNYPSTDLDNKLAANAHSAASPDVVYCHYPFLTVSNIHSIPHQDVKFLDLQGCLRVPIRPMLDDLVQQYFLHIHSFLPLVNEGDFWELYPHVGGNPPKERLSLLLFQAMLFASCTFVPQSTVDALGFRDIRSMRATYLRRTELLYNLGTEPSPLVIAQATLLLSFTSLSSTKTPYTVWLSLAIENARLADAHLYANINAPSLRKHRSILKRVWWCCIMRDRSMALLLRRPVHITNEHFDFNACPLSAMDFVDEFDRSKVYNSATKERLAEILAQFAQLYITLTDILLLVFPPNGTWSSSREHNGGKYSLRRCRAALSRWYASAVSKLRNPGSNTVPATLSNDFQEIDYGSIVLYTNFLFMYYHTSRIALCHHEVLHLEDLQGRGCRNTSPTEQLSRIHETRHELQDATSALLKCHEDLVRQGLARWLPISAIGCTALPLVLNILNIKLSPPRENGPNIIKHHQGNTLIEMMKTYGPQYDGVDWVSEIVRHIVGLAQLVRPKVRSSNSTIYWTDIFAFRPSSYLRLVLTLDLSLSKGRLPQDSDFPHSLRGLCDVDISPLPEPALGDGKNYNENHSNGHGATHESQPDRPLCANSLRTEQFAPGADESVLVEIEQIYLHLAGVHSDTNISHSEGLEMSADSFPPGDLSLSSPDWFDRLLTDREQAGGLLEPLGYAHQGFASMATEEQNNRETSSS